MLLADATAKLSCTKEASQRLWLRPAAEALSGTHRLFSVAERKRRIVVDDGDTVKEIVVGGLREIMALRCFHTTWSGHCLVVAWLPQGERYT